MSEKTDERLREAAVYIQGRRAGKICETDGGYIFVYDEDYLEREDAVAASLTLPLRQAPYESTVLFPFFDGLIPEGWLLNVVSRNWKISADDRFGLLLKSCRDCIGDVQIMEIGDKTGKTGEKLGETGKSEGDSQ